MSVCCECCAGRGLCDGLITHPEESYRLWCIVVCELETSKMRGEGVCDPLGRGEWAVYTKRNDMSKNTSHDGHYAHYACFCNLLSLLGLPHCTCDFLEIEKTACNG